MNASRRMALCGMLTALAVVILLLGGAAPSGDFLRAGAGYGGVAAGFRGMRSTGGGNRLGRNIPVGTTAGCGPGDGDGHALFWLVPNSASPHRPHDFSPDTAGSQGPPVQCADRPAIRPAAKAHGARHRPGGPLTGADGDDAGAGESHIPAAGRGAGTAYSPLAPQIKKFPVPLTPHGCFSSYLL